MKTLLSQLGLKCIITFALVEGNMADRKSFLGPKPSHPELERLLEAAHATEVTDAVLQEQRVSFAYGNAPKSARITKDSARAASKSIRIVQR